MRQNEILRGLIIEHPTLPLFPMVSQDLFSDDFNYTLGKIKNPRVDEYYTLDERIYLRSKDEEQLVDAIADDLAGETYDDGIVPKDKQTEFEGAVQHIMQTIEWTKVILVFIEPS